MNNILNRFKELEKPRLYTHGLSQSIWRIFGFIGNKFFRFYPPNKSGKGKKNLLNLGSGSINLTQFVNADFYRLHKLLSKDKADWMLDITKPLKCEDNFWDGVLMEHTNEHILYSDNYNLLKELYRTMRPGGVIRIVVPDLDKYLNWNALKNDVPKMNRYKSLPEAICNLTQNHLHMSVWNYDLMKEVLEGVGFKNVQKASFKKGMMDELLVDCENHEWQSLYIEGSKEN